MPKSGAKGASQSDSYFDQKIPSNPNAWDKDKEDVDDKLIKITLTEAKHYAKALHHFVIDNLNQSQLIEFADSSYRLAQVVNQMVDCGTKVQKDRTFQ